PARVRPGGLMRSMKPSLRWLILGCAIYLGSPAIRAEEPEHREGRFTLKNNEVGFFSTGAASSIFCAPSNAYCGTRRFPDLQIDIDQGCIRYTEPARPPVVVTHHGTYGYYLETTLQGWSFCSYENYYCGSKALPGCAYGLTARKGTLDVESLKRVVTQP